MKNFWPLVLVFSLLTFNKVYGKSIVKEGLFIIDPAKISLPLFQRTGELTIDHIQAEGFEVYGPPGLTQWVSTLKIPYRPLLSPNGLMALYPSPEEVEQELHFLQQQYPEILHLFSIGKSHEGRELWMVKISDHPLQDEIEPEVKLVANMHGDEIVGREFMLLLIKDLLEGYKNQDPFMRNLIENTEIYLMPSLNPDGMSTMQRGNSHYVDLNRDYPDFTTDDRDNSWEKREPETKAMMQFQNDRHFALSANFHGGAVVVNYPWDTSNHLHPFQDLVLDLSLGYATRVPEMRDSIVFPQGVTNGYAWYEVDGGMQDWSYYFHDDLQLTIEVSQIKWPAYHLVKNYYQAHKMSILSFLTKVHQGAGVVFTANAKKHNKAKGKIEIKKLGDHPRLLGTFPFFQGEFFKVLDPGKYEFRLLNAEGGQLLGKAISVDVVKDRISPNGNFTRY